MDQLDPAELSDVWCWPLDCGRKNIRQVFGAVRNYPQDTGGVTEMEIGYLFARREWGKGYATEAALAFKEYGFKSLKYKKLVSIINEKNLASIRVAEKAGMKKEKTILRAGNDVCIFHIKRLEF
ncbi:GNAT family N-acetyltransferase [Cytobacillus sp. NJ13]|nr:GNAT family N-acetyltransferase [Cytobacillus sp. NJ13]